MASRGQQQWNGGMVGPPKPPREIERPGSCASERCGTVAGRGRTPSGMVRVRVTGSREPARYFCEGFCARYGQALAELRTEARP